MDFAKIDFFGKIGKHQLFLMISEKGIFGAHNCFGHFLVGFEGSQRTNKYKIGKTMNGGNFQMHPPFQKGGCWNVCTKRVSLSVIQKNCA